MFIWILEKYLNHYRLSDRETLLKSLGKQFSDEENHLISLLKETEFYHGTGAYHYHFHNGGKYKDTENEIIYSLKNILEDGLIPQHDLFNETFKTGVNNSLSLTTNRIYARGYAQLFFTEGNELKYEYGPLTFWFYSIARRLVFGYLKHNLSKQGLNRSLKEKVSSQKRYNQTLLYWTRSFRKDGKYEGKSLIQCMNGRSDILNNFGFIIGIKQGVVHPIEIKYPNISKDEVRTNKHITPSDFSHIQTPLQYLDLVKKECKQANLDIPIIPLEFVELHNHKNGLRRLIELTKQKEL